MSTQKSAIKRHWYGDWFSGIISAGKGIKMFKQIQPTSID